MEDLSDKEMTQPQPEDQPAEASSESPEQAVPEQAVPAAEAEATSAQPIAEESQTPETAAVAEAPEKPAEPAEARPRPTPPAKPTGPRLGDMRPGSVVEGKVTRIERYGAFVDLGLVEKRDGLIHISELSPYRIRRVEDVVKVGDAVRARVVSVDMSRGRIALSLNDVDAQQYDAQAAARSNEPTLTSMAAAFERAYGKQREDSDKSEDSSARGDRGSRMRQEQELLMDKLRKR